MRHGQAGIELPCEVKFSIIAITMDSFAEIESPVLDIADYHGLIVSSPDALDEEISISLVEEDCVAISPVDFDSAI